MPARALLLAVAALLLVAAAPAAADDASVKRAFDSEDRAFTELGERFVKKNKQWIDREFRRDGPLLRVVRRTERLAATVRERIAAEEPSSDVGRRAKRTALASVRAFARGFRIYRGFVRTAPARDSVARAERAAKLLGRATRRGNTANRLFREAGVTG